MRLQETVSRLRQRYEVRSEDAKKRRTPDHLTVEDVIEAVKGRGNAQPLSTLQLITGDHTGWVIGTHTNGSFQQ